jgi:TIR domain/WD domain, G-beta repeat
VTFTDTWPEIFDAIWRARLIRTGFFDPGHARVSRRSAAWTGPHRPSCCYSIDFRTVTLSAEGGSSAAIGGRLDIMTGEGSDANPDAPPGRRWEVALSFAGTQRDYVEQVAQELQARGVRCFYDADEQIELWGKYLAEELPVIYGEQAAAVVVFVSTEYAAGDWTRLERRAALNGAVRERREYVLPARFDDTPLPGLLSGMVAIDLRTRTPQQFAVMIAAKLAALRIVVSVTPNVSPATAPAPPSSGREGPGRDDAGSSRDQSGGTSGSVPRARGRRTRRAASPADSGPVPPSHLSCTLTGHTHEVYGVAFSPDGRLIATTSRDKTARLWDPATGKQLRTMTGHTRILTGHTGLVLGVAFSPDGRLLASASTDKTARLWDLT